MRQFEKIFIFLILFFTIFNIVNASPLIDVKDLNPTTGEGQVSAFGSAVGFSSASVGDVVAAVIKGFLALIGVIFIVLMILSGYKWMMARGNEEEVKEAMEGIKRAVIGLIIIIAAYSITYFVFKYLPWGTGPAVGDVWE